MEFDEKYTIFYVAKKFGNTYTFWGTGNYYLWFLSCIIGHLYRNKWVKAYYLDLSGRYLLLLKIYSDIITS